MKDITLQNAKQEKIDKTPQKCFYPERGCQTGSRSGSTLRHLTAHALRQSGILRSMSVPVRAPEQVHAQIRAAMVHRRPIAALYRGRGRLLCPHLLGWNRHRRLQVLCYEYGGDSESGLKPAGAADNWRCLAVEDLNQVELLDGPWQTAENHSRPQTCIEEVELDVDDYPEPVPPAPSPNPKSAKL
jgi:hypothetical protein